MIEFAYRSRQLDFEYDKLNEYGNSIGTEEVSNVTYHFYLSANEKLRYDIKKFSIYAFAGLYLGMQFSESVDIDFKKTFSGFNKTSIGVTTGLGGAAAFGKSVV